MKAITLHRPWPWTFFHAGKRWENRPWKPPDSIIGKVIAIHAGKHFDDAARARMKAGDFGEPATHCPLDFNHPAGIVGMFRITGHVVHCHGVETHENPWLFGPFGWVIDSVIQLEAPIPCRGMQGFWNVPKKSAKVLELIASGGVK